MSPSGDTEALAALKKRIDLGDPEAMFNFACKYDKGTMGLRQDSRRALEIFRNALELGYSDAHWAIGEYYFFGNEVVGGKCLKKAKYHWEQSAMGGHAMSRHNLGVIEALGGNTKKSIRHFKISAEAGFELSMKEMTREFMNGRIGLEEYDSVEQAFDKAQEDLKSEKRDWVNANKYFLPTSGFINNLPDERKRRGL
ncbi:hypothetical protein ACHAXR_007032 [Thalassiosira sp. AJA248-18]